MEVEIEAYMKMWPDKSAILMEQALQVKFPQCKGLQVCKYGANNYAVVVEHANGVTEQELLDFIEEFKTK